MNQNCEKQSERYGEEIEINSPNRIVVFLINKSFNWLFDFSSVMSLNSLRILHPFLICEKFYHCLASWQYCAGEVEEIVTPLVILVLSM